MQASRGRPKRQFQRSLTTGTKRKAAEAFAHESWTARSETVAPRLDLGHRTRRGGLATKGVELDGEASVATHMAITKG